MPFGETVESVGLKLSADPSLLAEIESTVEKQMAAASPEKKSEFARKLRQHLDGYKEHLKKQAAGVDPTNTPAYQRERDRVLSFMRKHQLKVEA